MKKIGWVFWLLCCCMNGVYAQENIKERYQGNEAILYDNEDKPVLKTKSYYSVDHKRVPISGAVKFTLGKEKLQLYCDSIYRESCVQEGSVLENTRASVSYMIIFDSYLKIKDIRILERKNYQKASFNYDALFKQILLSTQGKWMKTDCRDKSEWFYYRGYFGFKK